MALLLLTACSRGLVSTPQIGLVPKARPTSWSNSFGDSAHTRRATTEGPAHANVLWTYDMDTGGNAVYSADGRAFVACGRSLIAYSPEGAELWRYRLAHPNRGLLRGHDHNLYVVVPSQPYHSWQHTSMLLALDLSGQLLWSAQLAVQETVLGAAQGVVFTATWDSEQTTLHGYRDGERVWSTEVYGAGMRFVQPAGFVLAQTTDQAGPWGNHPWCAYGADGRELWRLPHDFYLQGNTAATAPDGSLRVMIGDQVDMRSVTRLAAISAAGELLWESAAHFNTYDHRITIGADGTSYVNASEGEDELLAFDASGELRWSITLPDYDFSSIGETASGLRAIYHYSGSENWAHTDRLVGIDNTGALMVLAEIPNSFQTEALFLPDRIIYSGRWLTALRPDGATLWRHAWGAAGAMVIGPGEQLAVFEGKQYNTSYGDSLTVFNPEGGIAWRYKAPAATGWFRLEVTADTSGYLLRGTQENADALKRLNAAGDHLMEFTIRRPAEYPYPNWWLRWIIQGADGSLQTWDGHVMGRYTPTGQRELHFGQPIYMNSAEGGAALDALGNTFLREYLPATQSYVLSSYDSSGGRRWSVPDPQGNHQIIADSAGGAYLVGGNVLRLSASGAVLWTHEYLNSMGYYGGFGALRSDGSLIIRRTRDREGWGYSYGNARIGSDVAPPPPPSQSLLYAISAAGESLWTYTTSGVVEDGNVSVLELSLPVVDPQGNVYVASMQGAISLDAQGSERWRLAYPHTETYSAPLIDGAGRLYFSADQRVYALGR